MIDVTVDVCMTLLLEYILHHFRCLAKCLATQHCLRLIQNWDHFGATKIWSRPTLLVRLWWIGLVAINHHVSESLIIWMLMCSFEINSIDFLEFYKTQGTIGFPVRIALLINIPKEFSSKMTLEVAKIGLKVSTQYML